MKLALRLLRERLATVNDELFRFGMSRMPEDRWSTAHRAEKAELEASIAQLLAIRAKSRGYTTTPPMRAQA